MKKVLAISCLLVILSLVTATMAFAAEDNWRFYLKTDDGANSNAASPLTIGVYSSSMDGNYSDQVASDGQDVRFPIASTPSTVKAVEGVFMNMLWVKDVKSPRPWTNPIYAGRKVWDLRVAGLSGANVETPIRLQFLTIGSAVLPPASVGGLTAKYWLKMVNNKGVAGAYADGTLWEIPIPTVHSATPYFSLTLPTLKLTSNTEGDFINQGYQMEFYQTPEPSSLMALGAGLMALGGLASRKRRS